MGSIGCAVSAIEACPGFVGRVASAASAPFRAMDRGIDNMKMTALSAWAVNELGELGASSVEVAWTYGDRAVEVSAAFMDLQQFSARSGTGKRDHDVMGAVSQIIDDRVASINSARQRRTDSEPWWHVLGVEPTATLPQVKQAYRSLAFNGHPDTNFGHKVLFDAGRLRAAKDEAERVLA